MQTTKNQKIIISISLLVLLFGAYIIFNRQSANKESADKIATSTTNTINVNTGNGSGYTIEQIPITGESAVPKPIPDLNRPVTSNTGAQVSTEAIVRATEKILPLQAQLKKNPTDLTSWINLGMYQKMAGDYQGTKISWQYASKLAPTSYVPVIDLADLSAYFLKDKVTAEAYYKEAILKGTDQANLYIQFAQFYIDFYNDNIKALNVINQGLTKIPNDPNLLQFKASIK